MNDWKTLSTRERLTFVTNAHESGISLREAARNAAYSENAVTSWVTRNRTLVDKALANGSPAATVAATQPAPAPKAPTKAPTKAPKARRNQPAAAPMQPSVQQVVQAVELPYANVKPAQQIIDAPDFPEWALIRYIPENKRTLRMRGYSMNRTRKTAITNALLIGRDVALFGPPGNGKTLFGRIAAKELGCVPIEQAKNGDLIYLLVAGGQIQDVEALFQGTLELVDATARRALNAFILAIQRPGIVVIDEFNRMPQVAQNYLLNLLEAGSRKLQRPDGSEIPVRCTFVFTANKGQAGTMPLVPALLDRLGAGIFNWDYPTPAQERNLLTKAGMERDVAESLVRIAAKQRQHWEKGAFTLPMSTRLLMGLRSEYQIAKLNNDMTQFRNFISGMDIFAGEDATRWDSIVMQEWSEETAEIQITNNDDDDGDDDNDADA